MKDAAIPDQFTVDVLFNEEWRVERRFADYGAAGEYMKAECAKRFTGPKGTITADFGYRLREGAHVWTEIRCKVRLGERRFH